eukprot:1320525-Rhodomonas_salina.1
MTDMRRVTSGCSSGTRVRGRTSSGLTGVGCSYAVSEINWNATVLVLQKKSKFRSHLNTGGTFVGEWGEVVKEFVPFQVSHSDSEYPGTTTTTRNS